MKQKTLILITTAVLVYILSAVLSSAYAQNYNYNYNYYNTCTYHAYRLCSGNSIYWFDSCDNQQELYQVCSGLNQTCQYGQCVYKTPYVAHYRTVCYGNSIYWFDSLGARSELYRNCQDSNSCTKDSCAGVKCSNAMKCDGSTCTVGSADYNAFCAPNHCGNGTCEPNLGENQTNCPNDCKEAQAQLLISFFAKHDSNSSQWQKTTQVAKNDKVYFMIAATNNGTSQIDNVKISTNIPSEITSLGNLQIDGVTAAGDIVSGIDIGSLAVQTTKTLTFEGITQTFSESATKQATATVDISGVQKTDSVSLILDPSKTGAASVSSSGATSGFVTFLKRWYLWIAVGLVLIFLFVVVFRRLSSDNA